MPLIPSTKEGIQDWIKRNVPELSSLKPEDNPIYERFETKAKPTVQPDRNVYTGLETYDGVFAGLNDIKGRPTVDPMEEISKRIECNRKDFTGAFAGLNDISYGENRQ